MMEFKPRNGFNSGGYTDPKKTKRKNLLGSFIVVAGFFSITAIAFGWWSILLDAICIYLVVLGNRINKKKGLDK